MFRPICFHCIQIYMCCRYMYTAMFPASFFFFLFFPKEEKFFYFLFVSIEDGKLTQKGGKNENGNELASPESVSIPLNCQIIRSQENKSQNMYS